MLDCFQFVVRNHRWQESVFLNLYSTSSHCANDHMSAPTCILIQVQLRVVSQELKLCSESANKNEDLRNLAAFISIEVLALQAKGWSKAEANHVVISGSLMLERFAMESIFKTERWHNVVSPMCLNFYLYLETPNYVDRAYLNMQRFLFNWRGAWDLGRMGRVWENEKQLLPLNSQKITINTPRAYLGEECV